MTDSSFQLIKNDIKRVLFSTKNFICNISDNLELGLYSNIQGVPKRCIHSLNRYNLNKLLILICK